MKSYTDIEQSKKLAKILPLESADMWWLYVSSQGKHIAMMYEEPDPHYITRMEGYGIKDAAIPCWSLAALLEQFRDAAGLVKDYGLWVCFDNRKSYYTKDHDNPIDACYEMITKLHELKML